jgi:DNA-binding MarR family transcriptional regulator
MNTKQELPPPTDNIRTLMYNLGLAIDERLVHFRRGTPYEAVRPSDVRVFVAASRIPKTISDIARALDITRQAVQGSVQRLQKMQVIELQSVSGNKRDKLVVITARGQHARKMANEQIERFEKEFAGVIGEEGLANLRKALVMILESTVARNKADTEQLTPPA